MTRRLLLYFLSVLLLAGLCGCEQPVHKAVTVWTALEGSELDTLKEQCKRFSDQSGTQVDVLKVPFAELKRKFLIAAPADQGPDVILGPQDWLGVFATAQLLAPVEIKDVADFSAVSVEGVSFQGRPYAVPLVLDCLLLLRNEKLAPRRPTSLDDLASYALEIQKSGVAQGFYFEMQEFYYSWPFFAGFGCTLMDDKTLQVGFTGPQGAEAIQYLRRLRQTGLIPLGATNDFAKTLFLDQKLAMTLNGPWFLSDVRHKGVPYKIDPIPPGPAGHASSSFVGVTGLMLNAKAHHPKEAQFLLDFLSGSDSLATMALASGRPPARKTALRLASQDPARGADILAVGTVADLGIPLPNHPAANAIWEPMKQSIDLVSKGQSEPVAELESTRLRIQLKIKLMME